MDIPRKCNCCFYCKHASFNKRQHPFSSGIKIQGLCLLRYEPDGYERNESGLTEKDLLEIEKIGVAEYAKKHHMQQYVDKEIEHIKKHLPSVKVYYAWRKKNKAAFICRTMTCDSFEAK